MPTIVIRERNGKKILHLLRYSGAINGVNKRMFDILCKYMSSDEILKSSIRIWGEANSIEKFIKGKETRTVLNDYFTEVQNILSFNEVQDPS